MLALPAVSVLVLNEVDVPKVKTRPAVVVVPVTDRPPRVAYVEVRFAIVEVPVAVIVPLVRV